MPSHARTDSPCSCRFRREAPRHHDLLLQMEQADFADLTDLVETAVLWSEVEHDQPMIDPDRWLDFADLHEWADRETVVSFVLALQSIVRRTPRPRRDATVHRLRAVTEGGTGTRGLDHRASHG